MSYGVGGVGVEELERVRGGVAQLATAAATVAEGLRPLERRWAAVEERLRAVEAAVDAGVRAADERWQRHAATYDEKSRQVDATMDARWKTMQRAMESKFRQMEATLEAVLDEQRAKVPPLPVHMGAEYWHQETERTTAYPLSAYAAAAAAATRDEETTPMYATSVTIPEDRMRSWSSVVGHSGLTLGHHPATTILEDTVSALSSAVPGSVSGGNHPIPKATAARFSRMVAQHHTLLRDVFNEPTTPSHSRSFLPPTMTPSRAPPHNAESEASNVNGAVGSTSVTGALSEEAAALLDAAKKGRVNEVRQLLDSGSVCVGVATTLGSTPTHLAARYGHVEVLSLLLERGADANARHYMGWTPLHESSAQEHLPCVSLLLQNGSDVEGRNDLGRTPLHVAAYCAREDAVVALLEAGASTTAQDDEGNTPYDLASSDTVRRLLRPPPSQSVQFAASTTTAAPMSDASSQQPVQPVAPQTKTAITSPVTASPASPARSRSGSQHHLRLPSPPSSPSDAAPASDAKEEQTGRAS